MSYVFPPREIPSIEVDGTNARFPVHRIYCVGRNYLEHVREGGYDERDPPFFFAKPADMEAIVPSGGVYPYPSRTSNVHFEIELVVAIGKGGADIPEEEARDHVYGYAVGIDMTRRDLQSIAKKMGRPWEVAKGYDPRCTLLEDRARESHRASRQRLNLAEAQRRDRSGRRPVTADLEGAGDYLVPLWSVHAHARRSDLHGNPGWCWSGRAR